MTRSDHPRPDGAVSAELAPRFHLREATTDDVPRLRQLIDESVRALSRGYYTDDQIASALRYVFGPDSQLIADGTYYVVESGQTMVAAGGWSRRRTLYGGDQMKSADDPALDPSCEPARIRAFYVHPEWARRGLARMLLDRCATAARAAGFAALELMSTLPGEPLYRALGFTELERVDSTLPDGVRVGFVRMRRQLAPG